jgi:hypothetical protein
LNSLINCHIAGKKSHLERQLNECLSSKWFYATAEAAIMNDKSTMITTGCIILFFEEHGTAEGLLQRTTTATVTKSEGE